jgi:hypothetical protein
MNMIAETSTRRGDEQPELTRHYGKLDEERRFVLCRVSPARNEKATQFAAHGREVVALTGTRPPEIAVSSGQVQKLTNLLVEFQVSPWPRVAVVIIDTADGCDGPLLALLLNGAAYREAAMYNAMLRK